MHALRRVRKTLLVGFAALNILAAPGLALAGDLGDGDTDTELRRAFFDSPYTWCDAEVLASAWGKSVDEAKVHIGWKVTEGSPEILEQDMLQARLKGLDEQNTCYFHERNVFDYADAEQLAALWDITVTEAKAHISYKLGMGDEALIRQDLEAANRAAIMGSAGGGEGDEHGVAEDHDQRMFEVYVNSRYNYCDADVLAKHWEVDVLEAKSSIGYKVDNGYTEQLDDVLKLARGEAHSRDEYCYTDLFANFTESDVEAFSKAWDMELDLARGRLDDMVAHGQLDELKEELAALKAPR